VSGKPSTLALNRRIVKKPSYFLASTASNSCCVNGCWPTFLPSILKLHTLMQCSLLSELSFLSPSAARDVSPWLLCITSLLILHAPNSTLIYAEKFISLTLPSHTITFRIEACLFCRKIAQSVYSFNSTTLYNSFGVNSLFISILGRGTAFKPIESSFIDTI
jgi:hypothetical protein